MSFRPTLVPLPPRTNPDGDEHRRQIADYLRFVRSPRLAQLTVVSLGTQFELSAAGWARITGWNEVGSEGWQAAPGLQIWDDANDRFDFSQLPPPYWVHSRIMLEVENTTTNQRAASIGLGINGGDPEAGSRLKVYDTRIVARRQDFNYGTLSASTPSYVDDMDATLATGEAWAVAEATGINGMATTASWWSTEVYVL